MREIFAFNRISVFSIILCLSSIASAQTSLDRRAGRTVSNSFLQQLTNPDGTEYRVGIVNVSAGTGMLLSPEGKLPVVEFIHGHENWLWASAAEQLSSSNADYFQFKVIRKAVNLEHCPDLRAVIDTFYSELEEALSAEISLIKLPFKPVLTEITVDGTFFPIQVWTGENSVTLTPKRDINRDLHRASYNLHRVVSGCSNGIQGVIEDLNF